MQNRFVKPRVTHPGQGDGGSKVEITCIKMLTHLCMYYLCENYGHIIGETLQTLTKSGTIYMNTHNISIPLYAQLATRLTEDYI